MARTFHASSLPTHRTRCGCALSRARIHYGKGAVSAHDNVAYRMCTTAHYTERALATRLCITSCWVAALHVGTQTAAQNDLIKRVLMQLKPELANPSGVADYKHFYTNANLVRHCFSPSWQFYTRILLRQRAGCSNCIQRFWAHRCAQDVQHVQLTVATALT